MAFVDIQEAVAAAQHAQVLLPPTAPALPEEMAWQMVYTEGGVLAVVLALGVTILWRLVSKILGETRDQNAELMKGQVEAINRLGETMSRVQAAVRESDLNNTHAIGRLSDTLHAATQRLDKHESKLEAQGTNLMDHSHRISILESGTHRILPPVSPRKRRDPEQGG
jgi:hypothetical protein